MTPHRPPGREGDDRYVRGQDEPRNNQEDEVLEFDGLSKSFGDNHVLDGVSFPVAPGSMFGFCGSNGAARPSPGSRRW